MKPSVTAIHAGVKYLYVMPHLCIACNYCSVWYAIWPISASENYLRTFASLYRSFLHWPPKQCDTM